MLCLICFKRDFNSPHEDTYASLVVKYAFTVDTYMQKAKKNFSDARNTRNRNLNRLNDELQGVQRIMMQNIDDVLQRGENLSGNTSH